MEKTKKTSSSNAALTRLVVLAMLSAVSFVLYLLEFPVIPSASHLKLDFSDIPALIGGLLYGPGWGVLVEFIKNLIEMLIKGIGTQMGFGNLMNFIVGTAYIIPFCLIFKAMKKRGTKKGIAVTLACIGGIVSIIGFGIVGNYFIDPPFFKYFLGFELTSETLWPAIWSATAINAIKGAMLSVVSYPIILALLDKFKKAAKLSV